MCIKNKRRYSIKVFRNQKIKILKALEQDSCSIQLLEPTESIVSASTPSLTTVQNPTDIKDVGAFATVFNITKQVSCCIERLVETVDCSRQWLGETVDCSRQWLRKTGGNFFKTVELFAKTVGRSGQWLKKNGSCFGSKVKSYGECVKYYGKIVKICGKIVKTCGKIVGFPGITMVISEEKATILEEKLGEIMEYSGTAMEYSGTAVEYLGIWLEKNGSCFGETVSDWGFKKVKKCQIISDHLFDEQLTTHSCQSTEISTPELNKQTPTKFLTIKLRQIRTPSTKSIRLKRAVLSPPPKLLKSKQGQELVNTIVNNICSVSSPVSSPNNRGKNYKNLLCNIDNFLENVSNAG